MTTGQIEPDDAGLAATGFASMTTGVRVPTGVPPLALTVEVGVLLAAAFGLPAVDGRAEAVWVADADEDGGVTLTAPGVVGPRLVGNRVRAGRVDAWPAVRAALDDVGALCVGALLRARTVSGLYRGTPDPDVPATLVAPKVHRSTLPGFGW